METLPQDIIIDILSRLPAKSIGRSRCVWKPWRSLLSHPSFIRTHLNRSKHSLKEEQSLLLVSNDSQSLYSTQLKTAHQLFDEITIVANKLTFVDHCFSSSKIHGTASCDGLILVVDKEKDLWLINPTIKEIKKLPPSPKPRDHRVSYPIIGIGYDSISDDYKVVTITVYNFEIRVFANPSPDPLDRFVNVYSIKNGTWKTVESSPYFHAECFGPSGVFVDGFIHWPAVRTSNLEFVIVAFDFRAEKFRELPPPSDTASDKYMFNRVELFGSCLGMQYFLTKGVTDFWRMEEYGVEESWRSYSITEPHGARLRPICFLGEQQVVLVKYEGRPLLQKLVIWNFEQETLKEILIDDIPVNFSVERTFVESLVSPHCSNDALTEGK